MECIRQLAAIHISDILRLHDWRAVVAHRGRESQLRGADLKGQRRKVKSRRSGVKLHIDAMRWRMKRAIGQVSIGVCKRSKILLQKGIERSIQIHVVKVKSKGARLVVVINHSI